jgi:acyl-CoA hydrolase
MTPSETAELLATVQAYTGRTVGTIDVAAWHEALRDLPLDACRRAVVQHYAISTDWVMPAHVRRLVKAERADRIARAIEMPPDADPDDVDAYLEALRDGRSRTASGDRTVPHQQLTGTFRDVPAASQAAIEAAKDQVRRIPHTPRTADLSHAEATADMDRMLAEQAHRDLAEDASARPVTDGAAREGAGL